MHREEARLLVGVARGQSSCRQAYSVLTRSTAGSIRWAVSDFNASEMGDLQEHL